MSKNTGNFSKISRLVYLTTYYRNDRDFLHHAGVLSELLGHPTQTRLLDYVVAKCYRKIRRRLHDALSKPYWDFLFDSAVASSSSSFPQLETIILESPKAKDKRLANDQLFFFNTLPFLEPVLQAKLPRLRQALSEPGVRDEPIMAYNNETYIEYHQLLKELLSRLREYLDNLVSLKDPSLEEIEDAVSCVVSIGDALQTMVGGYVIEVHLKVITMVLFQSHARAPHDTNPELEFDEEIFKIGDIFPIWKAYAEWLKLMVVHFDAVRILTAHMKKIQHQVTIKVITTPHPDNSLLAWKELLKKKRYFDDTKAKIPPFQAGASSLHTSANEITTFLVNEMKNQKDHDPTYHARAEDVIRLVKNLSTRQATRKDIIEEMGSMLESPRYQSPGSLEVLTHLIDDMKASDGIPAPKQVNEIIKDLELLMNRSKFFMALNNLEFKGSIHCELNLVCFLVALKTSSNVSQEYKQIVDELLVIIMSSESHSDSRSYTSYRILGMSWERPNYAARRVREHSHQQKTFAFGFIWFYLTAFDRFPNSK